jgi:deoxyribose-phosphate aldolase
MPKPSTPPDMLQTARTALACLDLTSLNDKDTPADIKRLCQRAKGRRGRGAVAAVCVWPRFVQLARSLLPPQIAVAAVANFPDGSSDVARAVRDTAEIVAAGGQEVDVVIPYRDLDSAPALLAAVRNACNGLRLKVILETGGTVPETILARHAGLRVLALSMMTNMAAGMQAEALSHAHTLATAGASSAAAVALLSAVVQALEI